MNRRLELKTQQIDEHIKLYLILTINMKIKQTKILFCCIVNDREYM
jgi:hypothetical protein